MLHAGYEKTRVSANDFVVDLKIIVAFSQIFRQLAGMESPFTVEIDFEK